MTHKLDWTYPNFGSFYSTRPPIRGTIGSRCRSARRLNLNRVELPFDLVRTQNDENYRLNKEVGDIIEKDDFKDLYGLPKDNGKCDYILHTDPEIKSKHYLYWNKEEWRKVYLQSIIDFQEYIGRPPYAVEFHPGKKTRSEGYFEDFIVEAIRLFDDRFGDESPILLIENRTNLYVSTTHDMIDFYQEIKDRVSKSKIENFGYSVDVKQLTSAMGESAIEGIEELPAEMIENWHIHSGYHGHQPPNDDDSIDWKRVAGLVKKSNTKLCLPEVHSHDQTKETIKYFEKLIKQT